jgi:hypothetical protein
MEREQLDKKISEIIKRTDKYLHYECERLIKSGGIDLNEFDKEFGVINYIIPKIIVMCALESAVSQWSPSPSSGRLGRIMRRRIDNLSRF